MSLAALGGRTHEVLWKGNYNKVCWLRTSRENSNKGKGSEQVREKSRENDEGREREQGNEKYRENEKVNRKRKQAGIGKGEMKRTEKGKVNKKESNDRGKMD